MGHLPVVRGNHDRHIVGPEQSPRLCLRDRPDERRLRPGQAVRALGRFVHEAAAVDADTGIVYLTEDYNPDGFYRFIADMFGDLGQGTLQALRIKGKPEYNTIKGADGRRGLCPRSG